MFTKLFWNNQVPTINGTPQLQNKACLGPRLSFPQSYKLSFSKEMQKETRVLSGVFVLFLLLDQTMHTTDQASRQSSELKPSAFKRKTTSLTYYFSH